MKQTILIITLIVFIVVALSIQGLVTFKVLSEHSLYHVVILLWFAILCSLFIKK